MSFTNDIKKEILTYEYNEKDLKAELYGILKLKSELVIKLGNLGLEIKTASLNLSRRIVFLIKNIYKINVELKSKERANLDHNNIYYLNINDSVKELLIDLGIMDDDYNLLDEIPEVYNDCRSSVIRGFFLAKGSVNDPSKSRYHLEIACNVDEEVDFIIDSVKDSYIEGKKIARRNGKVFYLKKVDQIGDFLKYLNAFNAMFALEDSRIKRDMVNMVTRCMNCDIANSVKSQQASDTQLEDIKIIEKYKGLDSLPTRLYEAVILRTENPDSTLAELSMVSEETIGKEISKSGLSHCFHDLHEMANQLRRK